jgi:glutaredoxin-like protein NrdH
MTVTLYTQSHCPQCELTRRDMDILGIEYRSIDLAGHPEALERLIGLGFRSAPVVETEHGSWSGYDQEKIRRLVSYA